MFVKSAFELMCVGINQYGFWQVLKYILPLLPAYTGSQIKHKYAANKEN